jgi:glycosyltransferase involved in cell wall biosynthesis
MFARQLNSPLYNIHYLLYKRPYIAPFKYIPQALTTWWILFRERPRYVYVTNPPVFAALCVFIFCKLRGAEYIMDTHPPALYSRKWAWSLPLQRFLARRALVNVTDQERFKTLFEQEWGARTIVLQNPPKNPPYQSLRQLGHVNRFDVAVVNTFAADEPLDIILDAAQQLPNTHFYVMGDTQLGNPDVIAGAPENVTFTGYLRGDDYWSRLYSSRAVMVLTTYPYSLLGGAQDAVALHKPLILSEQPALTEYFTKGAVFVQNTVEGIVKGVTAIIEHERELGQEVIELSEEHTRQWEHNFKSFVTFIEQPA